MLEHGRIFVLRNDFRNFAAPQEIKELELFFENKPLVLWINEETNQFWLEDLCGVSYLISKEELNRFFISPVLYKGLPSRILFSGARNKNIKLKEIFFSLLGKIS